MIIITLVISFSLGGCKSNKNVLSIYVTSYPIQYLVENIGGTHVQVKNISSNSIMQRAQMIGDLSTLNDVDLFIRMNELEPYYKLYEEEIKNSSATVLDVGLFSTISKYEKYTYSYTVDTNSSVTLVGPYYNDAAFSSVDYYKNDPFIWQDPVAMLSMAETIKDQLCAESPIYKEIFETNFKKLELSLSQADVELQKIRKNNSTMRIVTMTNSYNSLQLSSYVHVYPVMQSKYGVLPTEAQLAVIYNTIRQAGVAYIAEEPGLPAEYQALYEKIRDELGLQPISLHHLSYLTELNIQANEDYLTLLYKNISSLKTMANVAN